MTFNRTESGLKAKYLFYSEPLIWVEGRKDIPFYKPLVGAYRIEAAGGKPECLKLADNLARNNEAYVVVLDGDYGILTGQSSRHRRIIILDRYSSENYFLEKEPIERVCGSYVCVDDTQEVVGSSFHTLLENLEGALRELVILDVANQWCSTGVSAFPSSFKSLVRQGKGVAVDCERIENCCSMARGGVSEEAVDRARSLVEQFVQRKRFADLLRGHFVFVLVRRLIFDSIKRCKGKPPYIDDDGLRALLALQVWSTKPSKDHDTLSSRLLKAAEEARRLRQLRRRKSGRFHKTR